MFDRKRMKWTQNLKITNLGSFNGRLKHSERKCKVNQNKGNHVIVNDQPLSSGPSYGPVSSGYNHIRFPKAALVDICTEDYSTTKGYNLRRNKYLTKPCKPTFLDIHDDTELWRSLSRYVWYECTEPRLNDIEKFCNWDFLMKMFYYFNIIISMFCRSVELIHFIHFFITIFLKSMLKTKLLKNNEQYTVNIWKPSLCCFWKIITRTMPEKLIEEHTFIQINTVFIK